MDRAQAAVERAAAAVAGAEAAKPSDPSRARLLEEARTQALAHVVEAKENLGRLDLSEERLHALSLVAYGVVERYA